MDNQIKHAGKEVQPLSKIRNQQNERNFSLSGVVFLNYYNFQDI